MIEQTLSHYRIIEQIGGGGMGVVYKAEDTKLNRIVALKFLAPRLVNDPEARERFIHEARAASTLQHNNICTVHEIDQTSDGRIFICLDFYEGESLKKRIARGPLAIQEALDLSIQIAHGLAEAHKHNIVHRDIKPSNILITKSGVVKILDFGLARQSDETAITKVGSTVGTPAYMSPEQVRADNVDCRTDVWALGVTLYEMLSGTLPFKGGSESALSHSILNDQPRAIEAVRLDVPAGLAKIVNKSLEKDQEQRYRNAREQHNALVYIQEELAAIASGQGTLMAIVRRLRRPVVWIPLLTVLLIAAGLGAWFLHIQAMKRWARFEAIPQIRKLADERQMTSDPEKAEEASALANKVEQYLPGDPELKVLWPRFSMQMTITTEPTGAKVWRRKYSSTKEEWEEVGISPLERVRIPGGYHRWKFEKQGYEPVLAVAAAQAKLHRVLDAAGSIPEGMVRVVVEKSMLTNAWTKEIEKKKKATGKDAAVLDYFIDRYEVTNAQYKKFVDAGGYQDRRYWLHDFLKSGKNLTWEEAMKEFVDSTGRPGPSTWEAGDYPKDQADYPVSGISWYEAAAYAQFVGKELPTSIHWYYASSLSTLVDGLNRPVISYLAGIANFTSTGPVRVGASGAMDAFGTFDMAGNVREWCWNETLIGRRIRGGAWNDFPYMYGNVSQALTFDRSSKNGFRCVRYIDKAEIPEVAYIKVVDAEARDFTKETPVSDQIFKVYRDQFSYSRADLNGNIDERDSTASDVVKEKVSYDAAYPNEKVTAYLFLPKNASPPYQTLIYFPGNPPSVYTSRSDALYGTTSFDFILKSGRAVIYPVYYGTYERNRIKANGSMCYPTEEYRDVYTELLVKIGRDFKRTVDYLESRKEIDANRLGFFGLSWGGRMGIVMTAIEERLKVSVLYLGGMHPLAVPRPEADDFNYLTRVRVPTLMLNGRYDTSFPFQTSVQPVYDRIGTPPEHKRLRVYETDHFIPRQELIKETLAWFDKYLGQVSSKQAK